jgi:hypothetical protein
MNEIMAAHLQETAIVLPLLADEYGLDHRLHIVVDATRAGATEEGEGLVVRIEHHLLAFAHIGPGEHHPAVAEPDVSDLDGRRHTVDQNDLVAPVELVGLTRRVIERYVGFRRYGSPVLRPGLGVSPDRVITAVVAEGPNLLVKPDQRQPFARWLAFVGRQKPLDLGLPRSDPRQRLSLSFIGKIGLVGTQNLVNRVARHMQFPDDLLHRPALHMEGPSNTRNRIHSLQLPLHPPPKAGWSDEI